jgi:hypothetical protein
MYVGVKSSISFALLTSYMGFRSGDLKARAFGKR